MGVKYKIHTDLNTQDLSLRISRIDNGWVIKAGGPPFFCFTRDEVLDALENMATRFFDETEPKEPSA
jgi:hypothetical protein